VTKLSVFDLREHTAVRWAGRGSCRPHRPHPPRGQKGPM